MRMNKILPSRFDVRLYETSFGAYCHEPTVVNRGALIHVFRGEFTMKVNFDSWHLNTDGIIILFPGDVIKVDRSPDALAEVLSYDSMLLREASLNIEHTVYTLLREDRCRGDGDVVSPIVSHALGLLRVFFNMDNCACLDELVLLQLKSVFIGFYDFIRREGRHDSSGESSKRVNELYTTFMQLLNEHYMERRDVAFYAGRMNVSTKYLGQVVHQKTQLNPKTIIDQYVILQLKLVLRTSHDSIKQIGWQYHFNDDSFFSRYFKLHTGLTPQQYRQKITE